VIITNFDYHQLVIITNHKKPSDDHQSQKAHRSLLYMGIYLYNKLVNLEKNINPKKLSKFLKKNLNYYFPIDRIMKIDHG